MMVARSAVVAVLAFTCAACSSSGGSSTTSSPAIPSPGDAQQSQLLAAFARLDVGQTGSIDDVVTHARNVCQRAKSGDDDASVTRYAAAEFDVTPAKARQIVATVRSTFCK